MSDLLSSTLKTAGYSLTQPRLSVFTALQSGRPRSMNELLLDLSSVIDRASVYRTIDLFEKLGIVKRIQTGWKYKIELSDDFQPHHHHIICTNCNKIVSFDEPEGLDNLLDKIALKNGFTPKDHSLEITGICSNCNVLN